MLEYLPNGDLKTFLTVSYKQTKLYLWDGKVCPTQKNKREVHNLVKYMLDIATGMHYISERGLLHRVTSYIIAMSWSIHA